MTFTDRLICVSRAYASALGLSLKTTSSRAFDESKLLDLLVTGTATVTLSRADRAIQWFSDHWPDDAAWPDGIDRPAPSMAEAAE